MRGKIRKGVAGSAVAALAMLGVLAVPGVASASSPPTLWVSNTTPIVAGNGTSCSSPGYATVQAAVTAAEIHAAATILICPGIYAEQVQVTGTARLTIRSANPALGATLELPTTTVNSTTPCDVRSDAEQYPGAMPTTMQEQDGFAVCGTSATTITVSDVTFDEAWPTTTCNDNLYGILVGGNDTLVLKNSAVVAGGAYPINGCQGGIGIQAGMAWTTPVEKGHLTLTDVTVSGYQKNGITVDGAGSTATISYDSVHGAGPTPATAQNGIQISNGAKATISHTTVTGNECDVASCGPNAFSDYQATGILFYGAAKGSVVSSCVLEHNDIGFYAVSQRATLSGSPEFTLEFSTVTHNRYEDVVLDQGRDLLASDRILWGNVGLMLFQYVGQAYGVHVKVVSSLLQHSSVAAFQVLSDAAAHGDLPGSVTFEHTTIHGPILSNGTGYSVNFES